MKNLAIIPARSGSKGLTNKNIIDLCGKPLVAYSIEQAYCSRMFEKVMVSTDSEEYADIAKKYGADIPFLRSKQNSGDSSSSWDVVREVLLGYEVRGEFFDSVCLLQPTSPLRDAEDIVKAYEIYYEKATVAVVSVCEMEHPPVWCDVLPGDLSLENFLKNKGDGKRQDYDTYYRLNGAIYIVNVKEFKKNPLLYRKGSFAYIMPSGRSVDIDSERDLRYAEFSMKYMRETSEP